MNELLILLLLARAFAIMLLIYAALGFFVYKKTGGTRGLLWFLKNF